MVAGPQGHAAQITELFDVVLGYGFEIPPLDMAAYRTMPADISTILQVMDVLDAGQEEQTQLFAKELAEGQPVCCSFACSKCQPCHAAISAVVPELKTLSSTVQKMREEHIRMHGSMQHRGAPHCYINDMHLYSPYYMSTWLLSVPSTNPSCHNAV